MEDMEFIIKTKNRVTMWSSNSTPWYITKETKNTNFKRCVPGNVHSSTTYSSQSKDQSKGLLDCVCVWVGERIHSQKNNKILPFAAIQMDLQNIILSELGRQKNINTLWYHLCMESQK